MTPDLRLRVPVPEGYDLAGSLRPLRLGRLDPTWAIEPGRAAHAFATPEGPATAVLVADGAEVEASLWGPGATWLAPRLGDLLGARDDPSGFRPRHPRLAEAARAHVGVRLAVHPTPTEVLVGAILQQRVAWKDAVGSWRGMCRAWGAPAPGPVDLLVPPDPARLAELGTPHLHPHGVEHGRAATIREACRRRAAIDRLRALGPGEVADKLQVLPGVGPWTAALVAGKAFADADAVPIRDLHLPATVAWVLAGEAEADDARMLELLEPFRPHRWRVLQLLLATGASAPRTTHRRDGRWAPGA